MNYNELKQHAEMCQMEADNMAYQIVKLRELMQLQSICDFNIFWLNSISPVLLREKTIEFLLENKVMFTRKITAKEMIVFDTVIQHGNPNEFSQFKEMVKNQTLFPPKKREKQKSLANLTLKQPVF